MSEHLKKKKSSDCVATDAETFSSVFPVKFEPLDNHLPTLLVRDTCDQSYKASTIVNYDSRVVPEWKIPHSTTLEL